MSQHRLYKHPVYRNAHWPNSYLIYPLSIFPLRLKCFIAYADTPPICNHPQPPPIDCLGWLRPQLGMPDLFWSHFWLISQAQFGPIPRLPLCLKKELALTPQRSVPIPPLCPALPPTLTCSTAHIKLSKLLATMRKSQQSTQQSIQQFAISDASEGTLHNTSNNHQAAHPELTQKSVHNPMITRKMPLGMDLGKRVSIPKPAFSYR
ncbi:MAG: hypothetical protein AAFP03_04310 [Cyanobacteria bacterium J06598_3]